MGIKLVYVVNVAALDKGEQTQAAFINSEGKLQLLQVKRDSEGVIRQVINTSTKTAYTKVQPYINTPSALNLTDKETREAMAKGIIEVYRSSGATNEKGEPLTREEQVAKGLARKISVLCEPAIKDAGNNPLNYKYSIISDTGASIKLEGEFTL